jgi:hypothetical protein
MTDPSTRVCPRCGSAAEQHEYCGTCGLNLFEQPELPTDADWEATQAAKQAAPGPVASADTGPIGPGSVAAWFRGPNTQARILLVAVAAALAAIPIVIATSSDKSDSGSRDSSSVSDPPAEPSVAEECVDKWNSGATVDAKQLIGRYADVQGNETPTYVNAGPSADVQDRCLITVAQPDLGGGIARQYVETAQGTFRFPSGNSDSITTLPDSVKQWNAQGDGEGNLTLGAP